MFVVLPLAPPVPMFIALVTALAVAFANIFAVTAVVGVPPKFNVVTAPPRFRVVATVLKAAKVVDPVTTEVVKDGEVIVCTPVNVCAASDRASVADATFGKV
jgi:hypothetical protein